MKTLSDAMALPLDGIRAVEASAGTGKTFTIATLYLRLILERDLKVDQIVVATFTRAAAAELSTRLRERLVIADDVLAGKDPGAPRADDDGQRRETRRTIAQALAAGIPLDALRRRARDARLAIDTAFIGTLHGFCHRALAEFGFETGQALRQPELIDDLHALAAEVVRDFWRRSAADAAVAALLADTWGSPEALAGQACDPRWRGREVAVAEPDVVALRAAFERARQRIGKWPQATLAEAATALRACIERDATLRQRTDALAALHAWARTDAHDEASLGIAIKQAGSLGPKALDGVKPKGVHADGPAFDDLAALCAAHAALLQAEADRQQLPAARLLRAARAYLDAELPRRLVERNLVGHDQAVDQLAAALTDPARGEQIMQRLSTRWKAALVDEFQDTDPQQWRIVRALFADTTLVMVGDPKQAIYGFRGGDVFAWLDARAQARGAPLQLAHSRRAGAGLCRAISALFSTPGAFLEEAIEHPAIEAADTVARRALLRAGEVLPALELWWLDPERVGHAARSEVPSKAYAHSAIQRACVAWIAHLLRDDAVRLRDGDGALHRLRPGHIAVLVNTNREAHAMQAALGRAGVPASCNLRASVYTGDEAADLALLLDAIAAPDDLRRARAARASLLAGDDAAAIATGIGDDAREGALLEGIAAAAGAVQRQGPLPWLHGLIAQAAPRLLALPDGERRLANYLQLAELLQDLAAASFGVEDLATRFARARVDAADDADSARLRLDTDADAVAVATVHAAKGLEYDVVLVPYAVLGRDPDGKRGAKPPLRWYHDTGNRAHVCVGAGAAPAIVERAADEIAAEELRKFYVAVTRAGALCVLPWGPVNLMEHSAAYHLLHVAGRAAPLAHDEDGCAAALRELCERAGDAARRVELPRPATARDWPAAAARAELRALDFTRAGLERDWQVWSFSRLVRDGANRAGADPQQGAGDGEAAPADAPGIGGARFGTAVHAVFEQTDFSAWRDAAAAPDAGRALIERCLRDEGLATDRASLQAAAKLVDACVRGALNATLPCGVRLCEVPADARRAEIEFHLALRPARTTALYELLHRHGYQRQRSGVAPATLHGLLTGRIDLTFLHAGRYHLIDWKTNRCPPYDDAALRAEIALHDYDLQWLIYTLALHRWLRRCLRDYDYDRDVGDAYYLFVRGMAEGRGVHVDRPPRALIEAMDALFEPHAGASA